MTMSRQFLQRYTRIQQGLQEQAELALAQAVHTRVEAEEQLRVATETCTSAQAQRNQCRSAAELQQWHQYVQALEMRAQTSRTILVDAQATEAVQRDAVGAAYREAQRWEMVSDRYQQAFADGRRKASQLEADEFASQRFGRGWRE